MRESIPIAARLFMGWKVGSSHSAQSIILGYTFHSIAARHRWKSMIEIGSIR